ncbi:hypothetical protein MYX76_13475 [Desulfobacterota bacterium AH_259_B03_O07]|nr:hypothetical protein [Desulfobacterota bacterium AH_259_B03_O07]
MKRRDTPQNVRFIVFREGAAWYAVGLEFNIVESGDDPDEVLFLLFEAIRGYVKSAKKAKAWPDILKQKIDPEYEQMWDKIIDAQVKGSLARFRKTVYTHGEKSLVPA